MRPLPKEKLKFFNQMKFFPFRFFFMLIAEVGTANAGGSLNGFKPRAPTTTTPRRKTDQVYCMVHLGISGACGRSVERYSIR